MNHPYAVTAPKSGFLMYAKEALYIIGISLFFPAVWANHFRLIGGPWWAHLIGFVALFILATWTSDRLDRDKDINDELKSRIDNYVLIMLFINMVMYVVAWIAEVGPGFLFWIFEDWEIGRIILKTVLLVFYFVMFLFWFFATIGAKEMESESIE